MPIRDVLLTLVLSLAGLAFGLWNDELLLYGLIGFLLGRQLSLSLSVDDLREQIARLKSTPDPAASARTQTESDRATGNPTQPAAERAPEPDSEPLSLDLDWQTTPEPTVAEPETARPTPRPDPILGLIQLVRDWFLGGNLFVRVGILLVFFGVAFLIKYAVDQRWLSFTLELRLAAVAAGGAALLGLGWRLRKSRRDYALLLQGAGIGILYLAVHGSHQLAHLLDAGPAFAALTAIGLGAAGLAVIQNAPSLAWFGFAGGFLAPILANAGTDDHVALFAYYALLNAAILGVAWFRSWRALNLLGFAFTFGIAVAWGVLRYAPDRFASTEPFLVLYFLFYVAITVLHALRQPPRLRGYVDATLLFGTPILSFACQIALVRHFEYGIAWSALAMGLFYLALSAGMRRMRSEGLDLLAQAFLALGIIFLSITIPFALAAETTAGAWALEGAGLVWIGARQGRPLARAFGLLLQAGAALAFIAGLPYTTPYPFANAAYLASAMIGIAGLVSAYWLDRCDAKRARWEWGGAPWLLLWGLAWWFGAGALELDRIGPPDAFAAHWLWYGIGSLLTAELLVSLLSWRRLDHALSAAALIGLAALAVSLDRLTHPAESGGMLAWPFFLAAAYLTLWRSEQRERHALLPWGHAALALLLVALAQWETSWRLLEQFGAIEGWRVAAIALVPLLGLQLVSKARFWPIGAWRLVYRVLIGGVLAVGLLLWSLWSAESPGGTGSLPWLPVLNPVDALTGAAILVLARWWIGLAEQGVMASHWRDDRLFWGLLGGLAFLWINLILLRALHHIGGIDYSVHALFRSDLAQTSISVLWGLTGVGLLLVARWRGSRPLWMTAALLFAAVVLKLFAIDLAASGTIERIVSFLAVGGLLVGIGWLSPLPPRRHD
ncbi:Protein of unknown function DUF2339, transmembrane [Thiorhodococcus drewsii AZ1]|uniref:DUF2339 domain-containing protein n=1 Tax=Thiorhodococcus drewsii AZ1 TaxID=765913 RepID=G2E522_9GAMM|nr:DUF2339 domain-containing protein [Thiorhodococcus drewsii]EGV29069.1 Protein of unknown function DUF2339, transmembrane [Thiorhodococcus drewsii AZ1]